MNQTQVTDCCANNEPASPSIEDTFMDIPGNPEVDMMAEHVIAWHELAKARVEHMLTIPEDTTISLDGGKEITLTGEAREAFMAGLVMALSEFGELPFHAVYNEVDPVDLPPLMN